MSSTTSTPRRWLRRLRTLGDDQAPDERSPRAQRAREDARRWLALREAEFDRRLDERLAREDRARQG